MVLKINWLTLHEIYKDIELHTWSSYGILLYGDKELYVSTDWSNYLIKLPYLTSTQTAIKDSVAKNLTKEGLGCVLFYDTGHGYSVVWFWPILLLTNQRCKRCTCLKKYKFAVYNMSNFKFINYRSNKNWGQTSCVNCNIKLSKV